MFKHNVLQNIDDYFLELDKRPQKGVYFYRINGYNEKIEDFIIKYYEMTRMTGVVIEGKIPNPDENNLAYYDEIMGMDFQLSFSFVYSELKKWMPRMNDYQRKNVAESIYYNLVNMKKKGKNDNILKNAYIKFMCWLYFKFERIITRLGENIVPKILYEGSISNYELKIISILSNAGCDVVLLQYSGDDNYLKLDSKSEFSYNFNIPGIRSFPKDFSVRKIREKFESKLNIERLYGTKPKLSNCTNAWIDGNNLEDFKKNPNMRGNDNNLFYNCFCRINGVWDKISYLKDLYQFNIEMKNSGRKILIIEKEISRPSTIEINSINRSEYKNKEQMLVHLSGNIKYSANIELQRILNKAFIDVLLEKSEMPDINLNKLTNMAVYLLCWLKRYLPDLFNNWKMPDISCFIYMGGCKNEREALFLKFLAKLPVDVLILVPDLNFKCCLQDDSLFEMNFQDSLSVSEFPSEDSDIRVGTAAYHAERELDEIMYQDSGMYRNRQYNRAISITLQTMYEEIEILWNQEIKYRPDFDISDSVVSIPVVFAKVSGIKDGDISKYWAGVRRLVSDDVFVIRDAPFLSSAVHNPIKPYASEFFKNGKLFKEKIKVHKAYQYGFLRNEIQDYIIDKLSLLIEQKIIKGTFENGTEYTIISVILNMPKEVLRKIQNFDFTKKNPKLIYINTTENIISLEDTILIAFLNLIGFDVVLFIPTGYMCVEKYFNKLIFDEHQIGEYVYDLRIPNLFGVSSSIRRSWRDIIFKRGG